MSRSLGPLVVLCTGLIEGAATGAVESGENMRAVIPQRIGDQIARHPVGSRAPGVSPGERVPESVIECSCRHCTAPVGPKAGAAILMTDGCPGVADGAAGGKSNVGYFAIAVISEGPLGAVSQNDSGDCGQYIGRLRWIWADEALALPLCHGSTAVKSYVKGSLKRSISEAKLH